VASQLLSKRGLREVIKVVDGFRMLTEELLKFLKLMFNHLGIQQIEQLLAGGLHNQSGMKN
jgi:FMN-dependent NADH-azoreductase